MKRFVFTSLSVVSLVLCLALSVMWARSVIVWDVTYIPGGSCGIYSSYGVAEFFVDNLYLDDGLSWTWERGTEDESATFNWQYLGFDLDLFNGLEMTIGVPYWFLALLTAILPTIWFIRHRRERLILAGKCKSCGYDLRFISDKCPECGAPIHAREMTAVQRREH